MKQVSHLSYKLEVQHSVLLLAGIHQNNLSFPNRAVAIHGSDQNAFHSAVNFVFYSNTYLYARHTPPTRDKGQQHNEEHSKLWSCLWWLFVPPRLLYPLRIQIPQALCLVWLVLQHKQARHGLPKLPEGHASSSAHQAETESQHRSKTDQWTAPCVVCKTCRRWTFRYWTYTVLSIQFFKHYLFLLCRSRLEHDRCFVRK